MAGQESPSRSEVLPGACFDIPSAYLPFSHKHTRIKQTDTRVQARKPVPTTPCPLLLNKQLLALRVQD